MSEADLQQQINDLRNQIANLMQSGGTMRIASNVIFDNQVEMRAGRFLALTQGFQPTDSDAMGAFMSAAGELFGTDLYNIGGVNNGNLQFGLRASDGGALFAGGDGIIDETGINLNGTRYALRHYATDANGANARYGRYEMLLENGKTFPSLGITFSDGTTSTELVANGGFETGDLTNWTDNIDLFSISTFNYLGNYSAHFQNLFHSGTSGGDYITSDRSLVTAGNLYYFSCAYYGVGLFFSSTLTITGQFYVNWYDNTVGGTLLRMDTINFSNVGASWGTMYQTMVSPPLAQSYNIRVQFHGDNKGGSDNYANCYVDVISSQLILFSQSILLSPTPAISDGYVTRNILAGVKELPIPPALTATLSTLGTCTIGVHYFKVTFVDVNGETLPSPASASVTMIAGNRSANLTNVPIGPWGTLYRVIYMTLAGGSTYFYANQIGDNTSTTILISSVPDNNLIIPAPIYNTTGSRPLFPGSAVILAHQLYTFNAAGTEIGIGTIYSASQVYMGFYTQNALADCNDGDYMEAALYLGECSNYNFTIRGVRSSDSCIFDIVVDGVVVYSGIDMYAAATGYNYKKDANNIAIVGNGYHLLRLVVNGKNAASSDYRLQLTTIGIDRIFSH